MKKTYFLFFALLLFAGAVHAQTNESDASLVYIDGTYYRLEGETATSIRPEDAGKSSRLLSLAWEPDYPLHITVPSEISYEGKTYQVTQIGGGTFRCCYELLSATLPSTITSIGNAAFMKCEKLQYVIIPESVSYIGVGAFDECFGLSSIVIPEGIDTIRTNTFSNCTSLSAVTLPSSLKTIEPYAFVMSTALPYLEIPKSVKTIGEGAFCNCHSLMSISLPKGIKRIETRTFYNCQALTSIKIPEGVKAIASEAFAGCTSLSSVTLPESIISIDVQAFTDIPDTADIYCKAKNPCKISARTFNFKSTLHVPYGCKEKYENATFWSNFTNIVEMDEEKYDEPVYYGETGVAPAVSDDTASDGQFYDLQGRPADGTKKGIYIKNGKKVLVR